jgi:hypothetical protein
MGFCVSVAFTNEANCVDATCGDRALAATLRCLSSCSLDLGTCREQAVWNATSQAVLESSWANCNTLLQACSDGCK